MSTALAFDALVEASIRAALVAGLIAAALGVFRVKTPALRHAAWTAVLMTMLVSPLTAAWLPSIPLPMWVPQVPAIAQMPSASDPAVLAARPATLVPEGRPSASILMPKRPASLPQSANAAMPFAASARSGDWRAAAVFVWAMVTGVFLLREAIGWRLARRLASQGVPAAIGDGTYTSARVMTPVVTGILRPRVMVPESWSQWGAGVRSMVLAHERAHVVRRDPLKAGLARVNRAVFWFHPLAWWMERHLSRLAERACDDAVIRELKDSRLYAALLVEMAHRLQHHGRRVAWQGIGIVSSRPFEDRLDRILRGPAPDLSRRSKTALAAACGLLMAVGVACGTAAAPLAEDPELAKDIEARAASFANYEAAIGMTLEQANALEKVVANNPDDLNATAKLLTFYMTHGQKLMGWPQMVTARRAHLLRVIERHPESSLVTWRLPRRLDSEGYEKARAVWLAHVDRTDASPAVLSQAAAFFERVEKPLAEELLLRGKAADPDGPTPRIAGVYRRSWSRWLGALYAMAIVGSHDLTMWDEVTTVDAEQLHSPFAGQARQKLDESTDSALLLGAGSFLINYAAKAKVAFDPTVLGREYVSRALKLDPASLEAKRILTEPDFDIEIHNAKYEQMLQRFGKPVHALDDAEFEQLPPATKLEYARNFLWSPYGRVMVSYQKKDTEAAEVAFSSVKNRAEAFQRLIDSSDPSAIPAGLQSDVHVAFGTYAMHQGSRPEAVRRMGLAASAASIGAAIEGVGLSPAATKLAHDLLDAGERESVAAFYDGIAKQFGTEWKTRYELAARAIREGRMPADYQRYRAGIM